MSVPFHKQTDPNKQAGQHIYSFDREPYLKHSNAAPDVTLSDYIKRKEEAFEGKKEAVAWRWSEDGGKHWFGWTTDWTNYERAKDMQCLIQYACACA